MYNHKTEDVWEAIGVDEESVFEKLDKINADCVNKQKRPSEKIEKMTNKFNKKELSAIILMMEFRIRNLSGLKYKEELKGYE